MHAVHACQGWKRCGHTAERQGISGDRVLALRKVTQLVGPCCKRQRLSLEASAVADGQLVQWLDLPADKTFAREDGGEGGSSSPFITDPDCLHFLLPLD